MVFMLVKRVLLKKNNELYSFEKKVFFYETLMNHYRAQRNTEPLMIHFVICFISIDVVKGREDNDYHFSLVVVILVFFHPLILYVL